MDCHSLVDDVSGGKDTLSRSISVVFKLRRLQINVSYVELLKLISTVCLEDRAKYLYLKLISSEAMGLDRHECSESHDV